jgi:hypothetical protein
MVVFYYQYKSEKKICSMPALVPARTGERVQHGGVDADVQAGAWRERPFVEQRADGVMLALAAQRADDHLERRRVGGTLLAGPPEEHERPLPVPREVQRLEQGRDVRAEELITAGGQEGHARGERVRGDDEHQHLRGGGEEGVRRRRRLVRPPRCGGGSGGGRGDVERERVERERGRGRRWWRGREEWAPFPRPHREGGLVWEQPSTGGLHAIDPITGE